MSIKDINPTHYKGTHKGIEVQVADVMDIFDLDRHLSQAIKYLLRAGKKPESSYIKDVGKGLWWCARALLNAGGNIDLPPEACYENTTFDGKTGLSPIGRKTSKRPEKR